MKPRKEVPVSESTKRLASEGEEMRLVGVSKRKGGERVGVGLGWGTGVRMMVCWAREATSGEMLMAGRRMGRYVGGGGEISEEREDGCGSGGGGAKVVGPPHLQQVAPPRCGGASDGDGDGEGFGCWLH